jgi:hypothetical protein
MFMSDFLKMLLSNARNSSVDISVSSASRSCVLHQSNGAANGYLGIEASSEQNEASSSSSLKSAGRRRCSRPRDAARIASIVGAAQTSSKKDADSCPRRRSLVVDESSR